MREGQLVGGGTAWQDSSTDKRQLVGGDATRRPRQRGGIGRLARERSGVRITEGLRCGSGGQGETEAG